MRLTRFAVLATACCAAPAFAAPTPVSEFPEAKRIELQARGLSEWTPGSGKVEGQPVFSNVDGKAAPAGDRAPEDTQTMQYDDGNLTSLPTTFGQVYGNRFSLGVGGVQLDTLTLNSFSFYFMEDSLPDTGLFFQVGAPLDSMQINAAASTNVTGLMNSGPSFSAPALNVIPGSALGGNTMHNDTFFLGAWSLNSATMFPINNEVIGLSTNGPRQQGYTAVSGTGPVAFAAQPFNAIIRANVTSPNAVPVELMNYQVD